jgi:hypothetical protein
MRNLLLLQSCVSSIRSHKLHKLFYILALKRLWWLLIKETEHRTVHIIHHLEIILITEGIIIINALLHTCLCLFYVQSTKMSETITPHTFHRTSFTKNSSICSIRPGISHTN